MTRWAPDRITAAQMIPIQDLVTLVAALLALSAGSTIGRIAISHGRQPVHRLSKPPPPKERSHPWTYAETPRCGGVGAALAERFAREGVRFVTAADIDLDAVTAVAGRTGAIARQSDVTNRDAVCALVADTASRLPPLTSPAPTRGSCRGNWGRARSCGTAYDVIVLAHVHTARACIPRMTAQGGG